MLTFLRILTALALIGIVVLLALIFVPVRLTQPTEQLAADWQPDPGHGEQVFHASDCVACHTAPGGVELAGGRGIESPLGTIWSTNITPDPETGIGGMTLDEFRAVMLDGIGRDGRHLYPAMPYENYRLMTERDLRALYAYLMNEVEPVRHEVEPTALAFPFNMRFGLRAWNWLALSHDAGFTPQGRSEVMDRGQYLVEGPGHCAACHSPRNIFMAQDGVQVSDANFLTGGVVDGWNAPSLRGEGAAPQRWPVGELAAYLATGRNAFSTANGEMGLVVAHSMQHLPDGDIFAIAAFLKGMDGAPVEEETAFAPPGPIAIEKPQADQAGEATAAMLTEAEPGMPLGARLYLDNCVACHFASGRGADGIFPKLQGNTLVLGSETGPLLSVILYGANVPGTEKRPMELVMQGYADRLSDEEVAELATFLRQAWGNDAPPVTPAEAAAERENPRATHH